LSTIDRDSLIARPSRLATGGEPKALQYCLAPIWLHFSVGQSPARKSHPDGYTADLTGTVLFPSHRSMAHGIIAIAHTSPSPAFKVVIQVQARLNWPCLGQLRGCFCIADITLSCEWEAYMGLEQRKSCRLVGMIVPGAGYAQASHPYFRKIRDLTQYVNTYLGFSSPISAISSSVFPIIFWSSLPARRFLFRFKKYRLIVV